jgi:hypothetical protein
MLLNLFLDNVWLALGLWAILCCTDYIFTLKAARMYQEGVNKHLALPGGYELNPYFKDDIAKLRPFSFRFFWSLLFAGGVLLIVYSTKLREPFAFVWGVYVGPQLAVHFRHIRNLAFFHYALNSNGMSGQIEYQHWLGLRLSSVEFLFFAVFFLFLFLLCSSFFFVGSAVGCLWIAIKHFSDSRKNRELTPEAEA